MKTDSNIYSKVEVIPFALLEKENHWKTQDILFVVGI